MKCKYCGSELSLKKWLKKLPKTATISQIFAETTKWEDQLLIHTGGGHSPSCGEKYAKSGILDI